MKHRLARMMTAAPIAALLVAVQPAAPTLSAHALDYAHMTTMQRHTLSGNAMLELTGTQQQSKSSERSGNYYPTSDDGCPVHRDGNVKANQNCLNLTDPDLQGRAQAQNETAITQDPRNPSHVVGSSNDYRRGDSSCYAYFSLDNGRTWADSTIPHSFTRGASFSAAREYWNAGGDTSVAFDTRGNAYMSCQVFQRGPFVTPGTDASSAVYVYRSTKNAGASWNFPGRPVVEAADLAGTNIVTGTGQAGGAPFEDKPYITVDNHLGSPFQDRVYVAYTEYTSTGTAVIYSSFSNDYGEHFSQRVAASGFSHTVCPTSIGPSGNCDNNQFANPFTGPDGAYYIAFQNFNGNVKAPDNRSQILLVKSVDGGQTFSAPVKVADFYDLPDCVTYQGKDAGVACVPEKGSSTNSYFRATNYPSGKVNPTKPDQIAITFGSYINVHSNEANGCVPAGVNPATAGNLYTGVKTPDACNNDILLSVSNDAGATFTGTATDPRSLQSVTSAPRQTTTDQFWQWEDFTNDGKLAVSYYDRQYGNDEFTGYSDISLSGSQHLTHFGTVRVTDVSNPPPTQFRGTFLGDYSGLSAVTDTAHPLWSDTRDPDLFVCPGTATPGNPPQVCTGPASNAPRANDQDAFTASVQVPSGGEEDSSDQAGRGGDKSH